MGKFVAAVGENSMAIDRPAGLESSPTRVAVCRNAEPPAYRTPGPLLARAAGRLSPQSRHLLRGRCGNHRRGLSGHPAGVIESASQEHLDLGVEAAEVGSGPPRQGVVDRWVDAQQQLLALGAHV